MSSQNKDNITDVCQPINMATAISKIILLKNNW